MNWPRRRPPLRDGSPGRARVFIYLALTVVFLLLSYQLVLSKDTVSRWAAGHGSAYSDDGAVIDEPTLPITVNGKELVLAAMRTSDMSWVQENVPDWPANIYRADASPGPAALTVPINKGNEAMVYLTYLIDRYWTLPDIMVFMHGGRYQWHNDNPLYDSVLSIKDLNLPFVHESGYVNLRCAWPIGCPIELEPARYLRDRPKDLHHPTAVEYPDRFMELFPGIEVPELVGTPCCSQFAVSRKKVHERDREEYVRLRRWLMETKLETSVSGRILEYSWHMVFGKPAQFCPDPAECYCRTYGYCNLTELELRNQWVWRGLELPGDWPETRE